MTLSKELYDLLLTIDGIFKKNKIFFWLDQGTLLGAVRDKKIITGDKDIDLSMMYSDINKLIVAINQLKRIGYNIKIQKDLPVIDDLVQIYLKNDYKKKSKNHIDINLYRRVGDSYVRCGIHESENKNAKRFLNVIRIISSNNYSPNNPLYKLIYKFPISLRKKMGYFLLKLYTNIFKSTTQSIPKYFFNSYKTINFLQKEFNIPKKDKDYLEFRFGKTWNIPNKGSRSKWIWPNSMDKAVIYQKLNKIHFKIIKICRKKLKNSSKKVKVIPKKGKKYFYYYPQLVVVIGVKFKNKINFMPCVWNTGLSYDPFLYGISVGEDRFTKSFLAKLTNFR